MTLGVVSQRFNRCKCLNKRKNPHMVRVELPPHLWGVFSYKYKLSKKQKYFSPSRIKIHKKFTLLNSAEGGPA